MIRSALGNRNAVVDVPCAARAVQAVVAEAKLFVANVALTAATVEDRPLFLTAKRSPFFHRLD